MAYNPRDFYFKKAKEMNFAARSIFKLEELDQKFKILKKGNRVLDLGCAPGSWSQYVSKVIGPEGRGIGIDLQKVTINLPNVTFIQGDAFDAEIVKNCMQNSGIEIFDVVISDMAPKTTGIRITDQQRSYELCLRALEAAKNHLRIGGNFIIKFFQSDSFELIIKELRQSFEKVEILKPKSTRKNSFEIFIVGLRKKP